MREAEAEAVAQKAAMDALKAEAEAKAKSFAEDAWERARRNSSGAWQRARAASEAEAAAAEAAAAAEETEAAEAAEAAADNETGARREAGAEAAPKRSIGAAGGAAEVAAGTRRSKRPAEAAAAVDAAAGAEAAAAAKNARTDSAVGSWEAWRKARPSTEGSANVPRPNLPWTEERKAAVGGPFFRCDGLGGSCPEVRPRTEGGNWAKHMLSPQEQRMRGTSKRFCGQCRVPADDLN